MCNYHNGRITANKVERESKKIVERGGFPALKRDLNKGEHESYQEETKV